MQTIDRIEYRTAASEIEAENELNPSSEIFDPFGFHKQGGTFDFKNKKIVKLDQPLFENLQTKASKRFNQPTALVVKVDNTHSTSIIEWDEDFDLGLRYLKPYPDYTLVSDNSTLLVEMLSEIDSILKNEYDWDEIDYRKPTPEDINYAKIILTEFVTIVGCDGYLLTKPYISNFEEGGASIKWKIGDRTLYLEIGQNISIYTKVWRESNKACSIERPLFQTDYLQLWEWIINADL